MGFEHSETRFLDLGRPGSTTQELYRMGFEPQTVPRRPTGEPGAAQFEYFYYRRGFSLGVSSLGSLQPRISLFLVFA